VSAVNFARVERAALCDLFAELGPDRPTMCEGWTTRDLAAHLIMRERRPDAAAGITVKPLAGHSEKVRKAIAARPFDQVIAALRNPPAWSMAGFGPLDRAVNTQEFFIHHEDVRRAVPGWEPRSLGTAHDQALWSGMPTVIRLALRRFPGTVRIEAPGYGQAQGGTGDATLALTGDPGELTYFLSGRQRAARVELTGPDDLVTRLRTAHLGV
jgi:uncharacterized protein (TIGR03085 family)